MVDRISRIEHKILSSRISNSHRGLLLYLSFDGLLRLGLSRRDLHLSKLLLPDLELFRDFPLDCLRDVALPDRLKSKLLLTR